MAPLSCSVWLRPRGPKARRSLCACAPSSLPNATATASAHQERVDQQRGRVRVPEQLLQAGGRQAPRRHPLLRKGRRGEHEPRGRRHGQHQLLALEHVRHQGNLHVSTTTTPWSRPRSLWPHKRVRSARAGPPLPLLQWHEAREAFACERRQRAVVPQPPEQPATVAAVEAQRMRCFPLRGVRALALTRGAMTFSRASASW